METVAWYQDPHILTSLAGFASTVTIIVLSQWKTKAELKVQETKLAVALQEHNNRVEQALALNQSTTEQTSGTASANSNKLDLLLDRTANPPTTVQLVNPIVVKEGP